MCKFRLQVASNTLLTLANLMLTIMFSQVFNSGFSNGSLFKSLLLSMMTDHNTQSIGLIRLSVFAD